MYCRYLFFSRYLYLLLFSFLSFFVVIFLSINYEKRFEYKMFIINDYNQYTKTYQTMVIFFVLALL